MLNGDCFEFQIGIREVELTNPISSRKASAAFTSIFEQLGRDDLTDILFNWDDSELSEDGTKIIRFVGRDREYSRGAEGGKVIVSKAEFINWLLSDAPFDASVYGEGIRNNMDWVRQIESARVASGLVPR